MVGDTRITSDTVSKSSKIYKVNGYLVGFAGDSAQGQILVELGNWPKRPTYSNLVRFFSEEYAKLSSDCSVLIATSSKVFELDGQVVECKVGVIGSGAPVARGYLEAKPADILGAVRAAAKLNPDCGFPVQTVKLDARARGVRNK